MLLRKICLVFSILVTSTISAQTLTISSSGQTGTSGTNWSISNGTLTVTGTANIRASVITNILSSVNLQVVGNTSNLVINVNESIITSTLGRTLTFGSSSNDGVITIASDISLNGDFFAYASNIILNANIASSLSSSGNITLAARGYIVTNSQNRSITTQGGNILLTADTDGNNAGSIILDRASLTSNGGTITLGGGNLSGSGYAVGLDYTLPSGATPNYRGIWLHSSTINAGGGNIALRGKGSPSSGSGYFSIGVDIVSFAAVSGTGNQIQTLGSGTINIDGIGGNNGDANSHGAGINFFSNSGTQNITSTNGAIVLNGTAGTGTAMKYVGVNHDGGDLNIVSSSGNVIFTGIAGTGSTAFGISLEGAVNIGGNGTTNTTGNVTLSTDRFNTGGTYNFRNTGNITIQPQSNSFNQPFTWNSRFALIGNKSELTIGKSTNTADFTLSSATSIAGPITVYGGTITTGANLTSTATSGTGILLNGTKIIHASGVSSTTQGANIDYLVTNSPWTASEDIGIELAGTSGSKAIINANGGNINISSSFATSGINNNSALNIEFGIVTTESSILTSGTGTVFLNGDIYNNASTAGQFSWGIDFRSGTLIKTDSGAITITGRGGKTLANSRGIVSNTHAIEVLSSSGAITFNDLSPTDNIGNYEGMYFRSSTPNAIKFGANGSTVASSSSNITFNADKIVFTVTDVQIFTSGIVTIAPEGTSFGSDFTNSKLNLSSDIGELVIGKSGNTRNIIIDRVLNVAGPITVYGGNIDINTSINTSGGGADGDILLKGSGNIIQADGKSITTSGGDVTLWSNSDDETTNGGYIYLLDNTTIDTRTSSDRTANDGTANDISGGAITLAGGAGTTLPTGYALNNANFFRGGINLGTESGGQRHNSNITMISGGGNIFLKGKQTSLNNGDAAGINAYEGFILDGGKTGNITLEGDVSSAGASYSDGINLGNFATTAGGTASYIKTVDGDITLTGSASDAITQSRGLTLAGGGVGLFIQSTGMGSISLSGTPGGTGVQYNILLVGANILANSGGIDLVGESTGKIFNALFSSTIGYKTGSDILSSTSDITVTGDDFDLSSGFNFNTTGILILKSFGNSFTNAFSTSQLTYSSDLTGLTIGKSTNTANVTISSATTIAGPITAYGGTITLNADLTTTNNGDISLYSDNPLGGLSTPRTLAAAGAFKYIPRSNSFSAVVTYPITNLTVTSTGLTIGNPTNDKNITINSDVTGGSGIELYGNNLAINANLKTTNGAAMTLKGNATIAAGKYIESAGNFTHDGNLIFKSDINGTAAFGTLGGTYTTTSGTVIVERFIPARRAFRFLTSSVTTLGSIFENWQENGIGASGLGTHITGTGGATNGFDVTATNNPSMFGFNHATGQWAAVTNTNTNTLTAGTPYRLMVRGDRTTDLTTNTPTASVTTLRATGSLKTGDITPTLNQTAEGYSFIGNPYQAPIDMGAVLAGATNMNADVLYYWDPTLNTRGSYVTRTLSTTTNNVTSDFTEILQPGQAVFVKKDNTANPATMTISETHKSVADGAAGVFRSTNTATDIGLLRANLQANINNQWQTTDAALALFNDSYSWYVTQEDASKMNNLDEEVSFMQENTFLAIAKQNDASETDELPIRLQQLRHTNYRWVFDLNNYNGYTPYLFDTEQNTLIAIEDGTVLPFTTGSNTSNRFKIVFQNTTLSSPTFDNQISLYPNPSNGANGFYMTNITANAKVTLLTLLGQSVPVSTSLNGTTLQVKPMHDVAKGIYVVQVTSEDGATKQIKWIVE